MRGCNAILTSVVMWTTEGKKVRAELKRACLSRDLSLYGEKVLHLISPISAVL